MIAFNHVVFLGNVGTEPEAKKTANGLSVVKFTLAVSTFAKGKGQTMWLSVQCWRELADQMQKIVRKGALVLVSGSLDVHKYKGKNNLERTVVEVIAHTVQVLPSGAKAAAEDGNTEDQLF
jgi:single-strand DNA-binding protein